MSLFACGRMMLGLSSQIKRLPFFLKVGLSFLNFLLYLLSWWLLLLDLWACHLFIIAVVFVIGLMSMSLIHELRLISIALPSLKNYSFSFISLVSLYVVLLNSNMNNTSSKLICFLFCFILFLWHFQDSGNLSI